MGLKRIRRLPRWLKIILALCAFALVVVCAAVAIVILDPAFAAQNIDKLRDVIGDDAVAQLETTALNIQDQAQQLEFRLGLRKPAAPWSEGATSTPAGGVASQPSATPGSMLQSAPTRQATQTPTNVPAEPTATPTDVSTQTVVLSSPSENAPTTESLSQSPSLVSPTPTATAWPTVTPVEATLAPISGGGTTPEPTILTATPASNLSTWELPPLTPFGKLDGEGYWTPYEQASDGATVAYRTFLEPDPKRPYSIAAVVAFDLQETRLHFVLGTVEPIPLTPQPTRTGMIPSTDMQPGILLATFNGGFKSRHGHYGAMADGVVALPPIKGLATVGMYSDGHLQMGEWGTEVVDSPDLVAWRQNGKLLVHKAQITVDTLLMNELWGSSISGDSITWRSAIGLSADGRTFFYAAGEQIDVGTLAKAMQRAGAAEALELDVNNYWVFFAAIHTQGTNLVAAPLLNEMDQQADRYLKSCNRDFFYITAATTSASRPQPNG
ncbi:MAG TPA: phosphodiester glycosidase family protein [Aggregatilineales bacterium]|nr:phosphodiester glycosidase family protein [Aggregatilineales bacterium]